MNICIKRVPEKKISDNLLSNYFNAEDYLKVFEST